MDKMPKKHKYWNVKCVARMVVFTCLLLGTVGRPINTASQTYAESGPFLGIAGDAVIATGAAGVAGEADSGSDRDSPEESAVVTDIESAFGIFSDPGHTTDFSDLHSWYWAYADIKNLAALGIINGYADGTFKPEQPITRGEFAVMLYRMLELASLTAADTDLAGTTPLLNESVIPYRVADLGENDPGFPYAAALIDYFQPRRIRGVGLMYEPDEPLLRSEAAETLVWLLGMQDELVDETALDIYSDADSIVSRTVRRFASLAVQNGIFIGAEGGTLEMDGYVGRSEACALLCRTVRTAPWADAIVFPMRKIYVPDADSGYYGPFFDNAVFVGDSITQGLGIYVLSQRSRGQSPLGSARFLTAVSYSIRASASDNYRNNAINLSWQGQKMSIEDCLAAMDAKELYIMLGVNDGVGSNLEYYKDLYQKAMSKVAARNPELVIRVQSCTPVTKSREKGVLNNANLDRFNALLKEVCADSAYDYIDVAASMKRDDGSLKPEYSSDKYVHMSNEGSIAWINALCDFARQKYIDGEWAPVEDPADYPGIWLDIDI